MLGTLARVDLLGVVVGVGVGAGMGDGGGSIDVVSGMVTVGVDTGVGHGVIWVPRWVSSPSSCLTIGLGCWRSGSWGVSVICIGLGAGSVN